MKCLYDVKERFDRDGVVELGRVFEPGELANWRTKLDRLCVDENGVVRPGVRDLADLLEGPSGETSVMQRVNLHSADEAFLGLISRPTLTDAAQCVLGNNIQLFRDQCFYKPPQCGGEVYMHQDNRYWHLDPPLGVVIFIALDECTVETGCVHFIKGSHRWGRVEHVRARQGTSILLEATTDKSLSEPIELDAGNATMHHCQILHWSPPNTSSKPRRAHTITYVASGVTCRGQPLRDIRMVGASPNTAGAMCNAEKEGRR
jgi:ectoine hydroxylase-related dioxygenase (phytanoyl-CoA dioxygenase family)